MLRDYETRAVVNLKAVGAYRYAMDPRTEVLCCSFCVDDGPVKLWVPGDQIPQEFVEAASNPDWVVSAFNDQSERLVASNIMGPRHGWPVFPVERHRCLMASALSLALPGSLDKVAKALGLKTEKDMAGRLNMMALAKPRKPRKGEDPTIVHWHDTT